MVNIDIGQPPFQTAQMRILYFCLNCGHKCYLKKCKEALFCSLITLSFLKGPPLVTDIASMSPLVFTRSSFALYS